MPPFFRRSLPSSVGCSLSLPYLVGVSPPCWVECSLPCVFLLGGVSSSLCWWCDVLPLVLDASCLLVPVGCHQFDIQTMFRTLRRSKSALRVTDGAARRVRDLTVCCFYCCCFRRDLNVYVHKSLRLNCAGALDGKELFTIEGIENWCSTPDNWRSAKNGLKRQRNPWGTSTVAITGTSITVDELRQQGHSTVAITGTSITVDELRQQGHRSPTGICRCTTTGMQQPGPEFDELQLWELDCLLTDCTRTA